ncbi:portal protein [Ancylobacter sp. A5.8]|uniref:portal protein n=1 Tax=Ancylobacter gelatini TaxID=2919920 RepID=UPI001F4D8FFF|nr:portal protein [Ancylobacter gelatini]MCJ8143820.1 portal protein [Ancylobacter gelatini]
MAKAAGPASPLAALKKRRDKAQGVRSSFQPLLDDAYKYAIPYRKDASEGTGQERVNEVYDHTAIVSAFRFSGKLQSDLAPPGETFFKIEPGPLVRDARIKEELAAELTKIRDVVASSLLDGEWDNAFSEMALDLSAGTGAMLVLEGEGEKLARFMTAPISEILLEAGGFGDISGIFWKRKWSIRAIRDAWPRAKFGVKLAEMEEKDPEAEINLYQDTVWDGKAKRWRHTVWCDESEAPISTKAYRTCPWLTPRYFKVSGEVYGRGPVMLAMPTIRTLNTAQRYTLQAAAIAMIGIYTTIDDGVFNVENSPIAPGAFWKVARNGGTLGPSVQRFPDPRIDLSNLVLNDLRISVQAAMMDQSLPPDGAAVRSATEILERVKRLASDHVGAFGRLVAEIIVPLVRRLIEIAYTRRLIEWETPIDQLLVRVSVSSPLAIARETSRVQKIVQWLEMVSMLMGPKVNQVAKVGEALAEIGRIMDVPPDFILTADERAQAVQKDEEMAMAAMAAQAGGQLAPLMGHNGGPDINDAPADPVPPETAL